MIRTPNQSITPVTLREDKGHLILGDCDLLQLATRFGTPLYVYDLQTILDMAQAYRVAFCAYPHFHPLFAAKAFMTQAIVQVLSECGFGFDLVSGGEIHTVLSAGCDLQGSLFNGNNKTDEELEYALTHQIGLISIDNFAEIERVNALAQKLNQQVKVLLRVTPGIECHTHAYIQTGHLDCKFGFDLTQIDKAVKIILGKCPALILTGLHAHIGSQIFETKVYQDEIAILIKEMARIRDKYKIVLKALNIGGGLGICYTTADNPPSVYDIADVIISALNENLKEYNFPAPDLYIEPGRSIVGTAGVSLYCVGGNKQVPKGTKYVALDGGMADNIRPALYEACYTAFPVVISPVPRREKITLAGRFCESGDLIIKNAFMPPLHTGDYVCVLGTGAYGYSMASNYNRVPRPAVVMVYQGKAHIIVKRETYKDIVAHDKLLPFKIIG